MKLLFVLAVVTLASATFFGGKYINVHEDGTIVVRSEDGKHLTITKQFGPHGQKVIDIEFTGPFSYKKNVQIEDYEVYPHHDEHYEADTYKPYWYSEDEQHETARTKRSKMPSTTQSDVLSEIMKEFEGVVDETSYEKLLAKVQKSVQKGKINTTVLDYLQFLAQKKPWYSGEQTEVSQKTTPMTPYMWTPYYYQQFQAQQPFAGPYAYQYMGKQWPWSQQNWMGQNNYYKPSYSDWYSKYGQGQWNQGMQYPYMWSQQKWTPTMEYNMIPHYGMEMQTEHTYPKYYHTDNMYSFPHYYEGFKSQETPSKGYWNNWMTEKPFSWYNTKDFYAQEKPMNQFWYTQPYYKQSYEQKMY